MQTAKTLGKWISRIVVTLVCALPAIAHAAVVILYHHVSDTAPKSTSISPA